MKTVARKPPRLRGDRIKNNDLENKPKFWLRRPNPKLDRVCDWLLENLPAIRAEAVSRGE